MKKENRGSTENQEIKPSKKSSPPRRKKERELQNVRLPFLVEFTYSVSGLILICLALTIAITSFLAGASLLIMVIRTAVSVTVIGALLMFISSQVSSGLLFSMKVEQEELQRKEEEAASAMNNEGHNPVEAL